MSAAQNSLICKRVRFYTGKDEDAFFEWIKKIDCIEHVHGAGDELYLDIACSDINDHDLRDLIGLFFRYNISMKQLKRFLTDENKAWFFDNKKAYWHQQVFNEQS